jgi:hypothetical protein
MLVNSLSNVEVLRGENQLGKECIMSNSEACIGTQVRERLVHLGPINHWAWWGQWLFSAVEN